MKEFDFNILKNKLIQEKVFTENYVGWLYESCVISCSYNQNNGKILTPFKAKENIFNEARKLVYDNKINEEMLRSYRDERKAVENGAVFLSFAMLLEYNQDYKFFQVSEGNNGIDYWVSKDDSLNFEARLEVSGIKSKTQSNNIKTRLKSKKKQTEQSDDTGLPAYIAIVEFNELEAILIEK